MADNIEYFSWSSMKKSEKAAVPIITIRSSSLLLVSISSDIENQKKNNTITKTLHVAFSKDQF